MGTVTQREDAVDVVMRKRRDRYFAQQNYAESLTEPAVDSGQQNDVRTQNARDVLAGIVPEPSSVREQFRALQNCALTANPLAVPARGGEENASAIPSLPEHPVAPSDISWLIDQGAEDADLQLSEDEHRDAVDSLHAQLFGLGKLEPLLKLPGLTDIFVNGPADIWYEAAGTVQKANLHFTAEPEIRALATRLVNSAGGRLDDAYPCADVQNDRGQRIHAVLPPLSRNGTILSIRIQPARRPSLAELQNNDMLDDDVAVVLRHMLESSVNFLISGGTGTGKTTLLNALLSECSPSERIVTVEDAAELAPDHPHVISLQSKAANAEGAGEMNLNELIRQALRMRPTRLVLGECRGAELADMLTAMNTGHSGTGGTVHANSASAVPARLYAMGAMAQLSQDALALQAAAALKYVVHISREGGRRFVSEIAELALRGGKLVTEPLCVWHSGRRGGAMVWTDAGNVLLQAARESAELREHRESAELDTAGTTGKDSIPSQAQSSAPRTSSLTLNPAELRADWSEQNQEGNHE